MKKSLMIGKTIARIEQAKRRGTTGPQWNVERIWFTDGSGVFLNVLEEEDGAGYTVDIRPMQKEKAG